MSETAASAADDRIEEYLDRLLTSLSGTPRQVRHTLAEVEAHLRDAVDEGMAAGLSEADAQEQALARIGPLHAVTGRTALLAKPSSAMLRSLVLTAGLVGGVGFLAIGGAGLVARALNAAKGNEFMTAPWPQGAYTQADCVRWMGGDPGAHSCVAAMLADHVGDFLLQTTVAAIIGALGLTAFLFLRRRWQDHATRTALPRGTAEALGTALAALAAVVAFGNVFNIETVRHGIGAGEPLSLAIAATIAAAAFAVGWRRTLRGPGA